MGLKSSGAALASFLVGGSQSGNYGATSTSPSLVPNPTPRPKPMSRSSSPLVETARRDRNRSYDWHDYGDEEADDSVIEELVDIPYSIIMRNYTLVPISAAVFLGFIVVLITFCWAPSSSQSHVAYPYSPHIPELLVGTAAWIVSYSLRVPSFLITASCLGFPSWLSTALHVTLEESLRWAALVTLGLRLGHHRTTPGHESHGAWAEPTPQDDAFRRVFWVALGWAIVEVVWSVSQGYEQLALYRDVLPPSPPSPSHRLIPRWLSKTTEASPPPSHASPTEVESISHRYVHSAVTPDEPSHPTPYIDVQDHQGDDHIHNQKRRHPQQWDEEEAEYPLYGDRGRSRGLGEMKLDEEMQQLINIQSRTELEMVFGVPPPNIPVFISILQRLDAILLTIGLTLLLSSSYLSNLASSSSSYEPQPPSQPHPHHSPAYAHVTYHAFVHTLPTFGILVVLHTALSVMWTELLPRIGIHTASYVALMVSLGVFFGGLASWGALV